MAKIVFNTDLICEEDLELGSGQITQERRQGTFNLTKINLIKPLNSLSLLPALDPNKFNVALLLGTNSFNDGDLSFYVWVPNSQGVADGDNFVSSNLSGAGLWEKKGGAGGSFNFEAEIIAGLNSCDPSLDQGSYDNTVPPDSYIGDWINLNLEYNTTNPPNSYIGDWIDLNLEYNTTNPPNSYIGNWIDV